MLGIYHIKVIMRDNSCNLEEILTEEKYQISQDYLRQINQLAGCYTVLFGHFLIRESERVGREYKLGVLVPDKCVVHHYEKGDHILGAMVNFEDKSKAKIFPEKFLGKYVLV